MTEPAKILFLKISTNVFVGQVPATVIGVVLKCWPLVGVVMVAAVVGGLAGIVPVRPTEPAWGGG